MLGVRGMILSWGAVVLIRGLEASAFTVMMLFVRGTLSSHARRLSEASSLYIARAARYTQRYLQAQPMHYYLPSLRRTPCSQLLVPCAVNRTLQVNAFFFHDAGEA